MSGQVEEQAGGSAAAAEPQPERRSDAPAPGGRAAGALRPLLALVVLALLLAAAAAGGTLWSWWSFGRLAQELRAEQSGLDARVTGLHEALQLAEARLRSALQERSGSLEARLQGLADAVQGLRQQAGRDGRGLALAEVRYLLLMANHRLVLERDVAGAVRALESADERLKNLAGGALLQVREAIADDLVSLRAITAPDLPGMALRLGELARRAGGLPLAGARAAAAGAGEAAPAGGWRTLLGGLWDALRRLVVVRRIDAGEPPQLAAGGHAARERLRLLLASARLAALRADAASFRQSVEDAAALLEARFDTASAPVAAALETLHDYAGVDLAPEYPDLSDTLRLLDAAAAAADGGAPEEDGT